MRKIEGLKCIITGASRGIGLEIAKKLHEEGAILCLCASGPESFKKVKSGFDTSRTWFLHGNLRQTPVPAEFVKKAADAMGGIDVVINNAGKAFAKPTEETMAEEWDELMELNARAPFLMCRESLVHLRKSEHPVIVNISSVVGRIGYENQSAYSASKHALSGYTKALARELQNDGIRVHLVSPGGVATEMVLGTRPDLDEDVLIKPSEIADIVWFLIASDGNATIDEINVRRNASKPFA
jgi:NAD(P)-dependent dehydrogenase (short-subunit alcohol dehydrogenase family)